MHGIVEGGEKEKAAPKLKPCPFCGGEAKESDGEGCWLFGGHNWIECSVCGCGMTGKDYKGKWNRRSE